MLSFNVTHVSTAREMQTAFLLPRAHNSPTCAMRNGQWAVLTTSDIQVRPCPELEP
jgi:hypothetical protein